MVELAKNINAELTKVDDVGTVFMVGGRPNELQISPDPAKLKAYGVHLGALMDAVKNASNSMPLGSIRANGSANDISSGQSFKSVSYTHLDVYKRQVQL